MLAIISRSTYRLVCPLCALIHPGRLTSILSLSRCLLLLPQSPSFPSAIYWISHPIGELLHNDILVRYRVASICAFVPTMELVVSEEYVGGLALLLGHVIAYEDSVSVDRVPIGLGGLDNCCWLV